MGRDSAERLANAVREHSLALTDDYFVHTRISKKKKREEAAAIHLAAASG
jgi:hypothetical protein